MIPELCKYYVHKLICICCVLAHSPHLGAVQLGSSCIFTIMKCVSVAVFLLQVPPELDQVVQELQSKNPQLLADTLAMAEALESLTVTLQVGDAG